MSESWQRIIALQGTIRRSLFLFLTCVGTTATTNGDDDKWWENEVGSDASYPDRCKGLPQASLEQVLMEDILVPAPGHSGAVSQCCLKQRPSQWFNSNLDKPHLLPCRLCLSFWIWDSHYIFWISHCFWLVGICLVPVWLLWRCSVHCSIHCNQKYAHRKYLNTVSLTAPRDCLSMEPKRSPSVG